MNFNLTTLMGLAGGLLLSSAIGKEIGAGWTMTTAGTGIGIGISETGVAPGTRRTHDVGCAIRVIESASSQKKARKRHAAFECSWLYRGGWESRHEEHGDNLGAVDGLPSREEGDASRRSHPSRTLLKT